MDDRKVAPVVQELQRKNFPDVRVIISGSKRDNDGIEGDADFDNYHDDVDWCE